MSESMKTIPQKVVTQEIMRSCFGSPAWCLILACGHKISWVYCAVASIPQSVNCVQCMSQERKAEATQCQPH